MSFVACDEDVTAAEEGRFQDQIVGPVLGRVDDALWLDDR